MDSSVHTITANGHKLKIQLRDIVWCILTVIAGLGVYFANVNKTENNSRKIDELSKYVDHMNEVGTKAGREENILEKQQISQNTSDIIEVRHIIGDLGPKVDKIDANVLWLMGKQMEKR